MSLPGKDLPPRHPPASVPPHRRAAQGLRPRQPSTGTSSPRPIAAGAFPLRGHRIQAWTRSSRPPRTAQFTAAGALPLPPLPSLPACSPIHLLIYCPSTNSIDLRTMDPAASSASPASCHDLPYRSTDLRRGRNLRATVNVSGSRWGGTILYGKMQVRFFSHTKWAAFFRPLPTQQGT